MKESPVSRRAFLKSGTTAAVVGTVGVGLNPTLAHADSADSGTTLDYPATEVGKAADMLVNEPMSFSYPDTSSPCLAIKMGSPVPGGVGPEQDIVGYSILCTHMGCPVAYDGDNKVFKCNCHYSMFDAEKGGQMITGQATEDLPRVLLEYNVDSDTVRAVGIDGLIYGRQANIL
jgi:arsenite oxidase small subunit